MKKNLLSAALAAVLGLAGAPVLAETWTADTSHSAVGFSVRHMMVSNVKGAFNKFTATVEGSPADPASAKINATIEVASVDTREPKRDEHLRSADFFDAAKHPQMTFVSTKVEKVSATKAKVTGNLTLRGVTKPVTLDVDFHGAGAMNGGKPTVGFEAETTIKRSDFGVSMGIPFVSDEVELKIHAAFEKQ